MYRKTKRYYERVDESKRTRGVSDPVDRPMDVPHLRRIVLVIDFDFKTTAHLFKLFRTPRIDSYRVEVDGKLWRESVGWARILEALRKSMPRVLSARNL